VRYSFKTTKVWVGFPCLEWSLAKSDAMKNLSSKLKSFASPTLLIFSQCYGCFASQYSSTFQRVRMRQQNDNFSHFQTMKAEKSENISSLKRLDSTTTTSLKPTFDPHFRRSFLHLKRSLFSGGYATFYQPLFNTWTPWVQLLEKWLMIKVPFFVKNVLNGAWN